MPGLIAFKRRWSVGSDDLVVHGAFSFIVHFISVVILIVTLVLFDYQAQQLLSSKLLLYQLIGFTSILILSVCVELAICIVSLRGSILDIEERSTIRLWLYLKTVLIVFEVGCLICGTIWISQYYLEAEHNEAKKTFFVLIIVDWMLLFITITTVWCAFDPAGRSWVKMKKYQRSMREVESRRFNYRRSGNTNRNWRQRKVIRAYQDSWDHRCRLLFCCIGASKRNRNSFTDIARLLSDFFRELDVVPSDVVAGLVLLRKFQRLEREAVLRQRKNGTHEFLSGVPITDRTEFLALNDPKNYDFFQRVIHFMYFAQGAYGWPMYFMINRSQMWHLLPELNCFSCCCQSKDNAIVVEDNCCRCNYAALKKTLQVGDIEIVYATYHVDVGETPFFIAVDYTQKSIVVSIRGTLSMKDILTDLNAEGEVLPLDPPLEDWLGHKGMTQAAIYIKRKLETENLIEKALMHNVNRNTNSFDLVFVGHSLGAGTAAILAILMKKTYPSLQCFSYSPPGGLISQPAAEYSKSFITSVVLGKDVVPRIGLNQMEALRADLINAIQRSLDPKWKTISCSVFCCGCGPEPASVVEMSEKDTHINLYQEQRDTARSASVHPGDSTIALTFHHPLYPPGRIIHIVRHHPKSNESMLQNTEPVYQAIWADSSDFNEVLISPVMLQDHFPDKVLEALKKVVTASGPRKPQRQSNAYCSVSNEFDGKTAFDTEIILSLRNLNTSENTNKYLSTANGNGNEPTCNNLISQNAETLQSSSGGGGGCVPTYRETSFTDSNLNSSDNNNRCNGKSLANGYGSCKAEMDAKNHIHFSPNCVVLNDGTPSNNLNSVASNKKSGRSKPSSFNNLIPPRDGDCYAIAPLASPENFSDISSVSSSSLNEPLSLTASTGNCLESTSLDFIEQIITPTGEQIVTEIHESQLHTPKILRRAPKFSENLANCAEDSKSQDQYKRMGRVFITFPQFHIPGSTPPDDLSSNSFSSNESDHFASRKTMNSSALKQKLGNNCDRKPESVEPTFIDKDPPPPPSSTSSSSHDVIMHYNVPKDQNNDYSYEQNKPTELPPSNFSSMNRMQQPPTGSKHKVYPMSTDIVYLNASYDGKDSTTTTTTTTGGGGGGGSSSSSGAADLTAEISCSAHNVAAKVCVGGGGIEWEIGKEFVHLQKHFARQRCSTQHHHVDDDVLKAQNLLSQAGLERLIACMSRPLDTGVRSQSTNDDEKKRHASVLITLCVNEEDDSVSILYTKRSAELSRHVRQICFPGGMKDPTDKDYIDCALRETEEEIGLPRDRVQILGSGSLLVIPGSSSITPAFGVVRNLHVDELTLNKREVDEVYLIPVKSLAAPNALRHTQFKYGYSAPVFVAGHFKIWGITAYMTHNFLKCLLPIDVYDKNNAFKYVSVHPTQKKQRTQ